MQTHEKKNTAAFGGGVFLAVGGFLPPRAYPLGRFGAGRRP
ncbi:MAG: hypothetical protein HSCHL_1674 [Hydrogenibacillus schlegelii]|uniref:Uncharacterized protein n=1 Tax=Hydrogenibacillus schlegelii TaxID=1484 RepID=A0A2T5GBP2_HYDSH|nr:MAG: hypothetical protein HSCHL_1674 [Hydrogenibacillus schlegelii]